MTARFCSQCGTALNPGAKFCSECGTDLRTDAPPVAVAGAAAATGTPAAAPWQITTAGLTVLGSLAVAGIGIWAMILTPEPPRAAPGRGAPPQAAASATPPAPVELPAEVTTFMNDLATNAKAAPDDLAMWNRLGQVYYRAAQIDPKWYAEAMAAFEHVLARDESNRDALRGKANIFYDRQDHVQAIPLYERILVLQPDDPNAETDLATMYLYAGDPAKAIRKYEEVLQRHPDFLQAHYNLAVTHAQLGHTDLALTSFRNARRLATDDNVRKQIDEMTARLTGERAPTGMGGAGTPAPGSMAAVPPPAGEPPAGALPAIPPPPPPPPPNPDLSAFQNAVERSFRTAPIMGERITGFEWTGPGSARVVVENFPMDAMPQEVRDRFTARLAADVRTAVAAHPTEGVKLDLVDQGSGGVMASIAP
ncbi:MAG: tetratricopeptide repeat protein [bacterium]|nr:tetratricopeptide repeat protein [bacterium]